MVQDLLELDLLELVTVQDLLLEGLQNFLELQFKTF